MCRGRPGSLVRCQYRLAVLHHFNDHPVTPCHRQGLRASWSPSAVFWAVPPEGSPSKWEPIDLDDRPGAPSGRTASYAPLIFFGVVRMTRCPAALLLSISSALPSMLPFVAPAALVLQPAGLAAALFSHTRLTPCTAAYAGARVGELSVSAIVVSKSAVLLSLRGPHFLRQRGRRQSVCRRRLVARRRP